MFFDGELISFEDYGNINFGYVGTALGMPEDLLIAGSIYAHFTANKNFDDSEIDHYYIRKGIGHYQK